MAAGQGRHSAIIVTLTPEEHRLLHAWQRSSKVSALQARRGRVLLLVADGMSISAVARRLEMNRHVVYRWLRRWQAGGSAALVGKPRGTPMRTAARALQSRRGRIDRKTNNQRRADTAPPTA